MNSHIRQQRHARIRQRLSGSSARPRVSVHRSTRYVSVQLIDDVAGVTLLTVHGKDVPGKTKLDQAQAVGHKTAELANKAGITTVVFDRGGYHYHGRVKALADGLRAGGLIV